MVIIYEMDSMDDVSSQVKNELLVCKSHGVYERWWKKYEDFKTTHGYTNDKFSVLMEFMRFLSETYKVSACCLNKYLRVHQNLDHMNNSIFKRNQEFLRKQILIGICWLLKKTITNIRVANNEQISLQFNNQRPINLGKVIPLLLLLVLAVTSPAHQLATFKVGLFVCCLKKVVCWLFEFGRPLYWTLLST